MNDRNVIRRRRIVALTCVIGSIALLTAYFGETVDGPLHAIQRGAQRLLGPLESGASRALKPVRDSASWVDEALEAKGENERLKAELARARAELARAQVDQRDAAQLRELAELSIDPRYPDGGEPVTARVIARSPTRWFGTVQIDKGSGDGVKLDQPVVTGDGLAGKVTVVTGGTATVALLTEETTAVSAQVVPDGANGVVAPVLGDFRNVALQFIEKGRPVREGQTVVTSGFSDTAEGLSSRFPRGIPIGVVDEVDPATREQYQRVGIRLFADLQHMDYVQVLTRPGAGERAEVRP